MIEYTCSRSSRKVDLQRLGAVLYIDEISSSQSVIRRFKFVLQAKVTDMIVDEFVNDMCRNRVFWTINNGSHYQARIIIGRWKREF